MFNWGGGVLFSRDFIFVWEILKTLFFNIYFVKLLTLLTIFTLHSSQIQGVSDRLSSRVWFSHLMQVFRATRRSLLSWCAYCSSTSTSSMSTLRPILPMILKTLNDIKNIGLKWVDSHCFTLFTRHFRSIVLNEIVVLNHPQSFYQKEKKHQSFFGSEIW